jgi:diguanylate cyclase (GGDEF)-like protein
MVMFCSTFIGYANIKKSNMDNEKERSYSVATAYAEDLKKDFAYGINVSEKIKYEIVANDGKVDDFDSYAKKLLLQYIGRIDIAPDGIVTDTYPNWTENESRSDLSTSADIGRIEEYARKKRKPVLYGPVTFDGLGRGVGVLNPVFLDDPSGEEHFWGYVIVVIKIPDVYKNTLKMIRSFGYDYCVDSTINPVSNKSKRVEYYGPEKETLRDPVGCTINIGGCHWNLNIEPENGWSTAVARNFLTFGCIISLFWIIGIIMFLRLLEQKKKLRSMAYTDTLTGILNRAGFIHEMHKLIKKDPAADVTAVMLDLDDFKLVNDMYGHAVGDMALNDMARYLLDSFPGESVIGRTGGDEFSLLIPGRSPEECESLIQDITKDTRSFDANSKTKVTYTMSAGFVDYPGQAGDITSLMIKADEALYAAKMEGKHKAMHFTDSMSLMKRESLGFSAKSIAAGVPGAFFIYEAYGEKKILFANDSMIKLFGCEDMNDFLDYTGGSFRGIVYKDDLDRVEKSIKEQIDSQKDDRNKGYKDDFAEYRIMRKDGKIKHVIDMGRLVRDEHHGLIFFVFIRIDERNTSGRI